MQTTNLAIRKRIVTLFLFFILGFLGLMGRMFWVQIVRGAELSEKALENRMRDVPVKAKRGVVYDRNGRELAISVSADSVYANPAEVRKSGRAEEIAHTLAQILGLEEENVYQRITKVSGFEWIKRQVDFKTSAQLKKLDLPGIGLVEESRRFYPKKSLACHVLGISSIDNIGLEGVDRQYNDIIGGIPGRIVIEHDAVGREIPEATHRYIPPTDGASVVLTIDETIQYIVERELDRVWEARKPKGAIAVVMDPRTGEVLAMANRPCFDPNDYKQYPEVNRRNLAIWYAYEPGSTMKIVTAAAGLEEGVVRPNSRFFCPGSIKVGKETISCSQGRAHGAQTFVEVVEHSCNVGFVSLGLELGLDKYYQYLNAFGFGQKTGIDLPGEAKGILVPRTRAKQIDLATMAMGQANAVTPIQLLTAVSTVANDGVMMKPHLLKEVLDADGKVVKRVEPEPVRQVISKATARELALILEGVVQNGTGQNAYIEGYRVAGKTGTAQKISPSGGYLPNEYVASFVGFAPANNPRLACIVVIDAPQGYPYYGGTVAAPVFREIMRDSLRYLEVPLQGVPKVEKGETKETVSVPDVVNLTLDDALTIIKRQGLEVQVEGSGDLIWSQAPRAYSKVKKGTKVIVYLSEVNQQAGEEEVTVPDLQGKSMREVARILAKIGLHMEPQGYGLAAKQNPAPGAMVKSGSVVVVEFGPAP
ncbi:MAG: stage V sporulation protein D [Syntrophothermus sp.]|uniref:stage V sporulation protein D n=1 Tax=Syntrophothermus sp. TaxID=2736299 RepID=UPI0025810408|nr:stage V sporulation protein D [Syntrophothermus sp.]NSW83744.1 stage V sporulation protein D [Syntrophothermus sp.]